MLASITNEFDSIELSKDYADLPTGSSSSVSAPERRCEGRPG
jgi:hypothetical protein